MRHSQKKQFHIPHSRILEWNWNVDFHICNANSQQLSVRKAAEQKAMTYREEVEGAGISTLLKCIEMWNVEWKSTFQFHSRILECGMWNCFFEDVSFLTLLKCIGMWNVEWKSTFQFQFQNYGMWNVELFF